MGDGGGMRVTQLWRYPVKSLAGQRLERATVGALGIDGDRGVGLVDLETGHVLTARRVPALLHAEPALDDGDGDGGDGGDGDGDGGRGRVRVRLPDGTVTGDDEVLSAWLGRRVALRRPEPGERGRYEIAVDDDEPDGEWITWEGPEDVFHDSTRTRVSIVSESSLGSWDVRRFRPNVVVAGGDERGLVGQRIRIGAVVLEVVKEIDRCVVVTRPQPGLERDRDVLVQVHRQRAGNLGVGAMVVTPGVVAVGDEVRVLDG